MRTALSFMINAFSAHSGQTPLLSGCAVKLSSMPGVQRLHEQNKRRGALPGFSPFPSGA
jgi:hypothetical protein